MKDSRYAALAKSLFDPNCAYGVLAVRRSKYADEFIENFITSDEVQQETISFITKISTLFTSAGEEPKLILSPNIISAQEVESLPSPETAKANGVVPKILTSNGYQGLGDYKVRPLELPEMQKQKIAVTSPSIDATAPVAAPESCISPRSASPDVSVLVAEAPVAAVQSTLNASTAEGKAPASPGATATAPPPAPTGTADDQVESPKKPDASSLPVRAPVSSLGPHAAPTVQRKVPPEGRKSTFSVSTNGKVNTPFSGKIEGKNENGMPVVICGVELPEDLGLKFDCERGELVGTPLKSGEFKGRILYKFQGSSTIDPVLEGECSVVINHDPKTLWKSEQSDQNDPYWKKDEDQALFSGNDGLSMVAASKRGRSHAHVGSFRDDDFCIAEEVGSGWRVLTVADGAGSAKKSRKGSLLASRAATNHVLKVLVEEKGMLLDKALDLWETDRTEAGKEIQAQLYYLFGNAAKSAVQAIETEATATGCAYKDFSTTLVMTIHKKVPVGHFIAAYWVLVCTATAPK